MWKFHRRYHGQGQHQGFLGVVAHYVDHKGDLQDLPIALPQLTGAHTGDKMAEVVTEILYPFNISSSTLGYFVLDNAANNDTTMEKLASISSFDFNVTHRHLRCGAHTLNLIS
jgi:hypothetical protein